MQLKQKLEDRRIKRKSLLLFLIAAAVLIVVGINVVTMKVEIDGKRAELDSINASLNELNVANEQLRRYCSNENRLAYIEQIARDQLDYSYPDETIYYFVPNPVG